MADFNKVGGQTYLGATYVSGGTHDVDLATLEDGHFVIAAEPASRVTNVSRGG